ncbi:PepSY-like domain-containing protein [Empedobacter sedimenti]|uniref:PepSY-like domain-containing protein n=1 Tax=Empedobacter sedimenti TaxID=3042610 RepID=UPI0024A65563|nr:PepSY-like domain-containing protein [Empedobacter sedimenti]
MKKIILPIVVTFSFTLFIFACKSDDGISYELSKVDQTVLSTQMNNFLKTNFNQFSVKEVNQFEPLKPDGSIYEVNLDEQFLIDFDKVGNWTSIEKTGKNIFPANIIHQSIQLYISKAYKNQTIEKIERIKEGFIVELAHDIDLKFNKNGEFIERLP